MIETEEKTLMRYTLIPSPLGDLVAQRDDLGITGLYLPTGRHAVTDRITGVRDEDGFENLRLQLAQYFAGRRRVFDLPLHATGSPFQKRVWAALCEIPYGETRSYSETAQAIGAPTASRAVGLANGQNPISIVVPCHRVVGASGALTGYAGGVEAKRRLLALEAA